MGIINICLYFDYEIIFAYIWVKRNIWSITMKVNDYDLKYISQQCQFIVIKIFNFLVVSCGIFTSFNSLNRLWDYSSVQNLIIF